MRPAIQALLVRGMKFIGRSAKLERISAHLIQ